MWVPPPDLRGARRLLCVQPHYDDNDIGAGGTIAALAAAGARVTYLTVTDDLLGVRDPDLSDDAARERLRGEQERAGAAIGVAEQIWLGHPDGGEYDYFRVRREIVAQIRRLCPDVVFGVDAWMPYEAHSDHRTVGRATAEAVLMHGLPRFRADAEIDAAYFTGPGAPGAPQAERHELRALALYMTARPNRFFDIGSSRERKHRALDAYASQFSAPELALLHAVLDQKERGWARAGAGAGVCAEHAEALVLLAPAHLHVNPDAEEMFSGPAAPAASS